MFAEVRMIRDTDAPKAISLIKAKYNKRKTKPVKLTYGVSIDIGRVRDYLRDAPGSCARIIAQDISEGGAKPHLMTYNRALTALRAIHQQDDGATYIPKGYTLQGRQRHHFII